MQTRRGPGRERRQGYSEVLSKKHERPRLFTDDSARLPIRPWACYEKGPKRFASAQWFHPVSVNRSITNLDFARSTDDYLDLVIATGPAQRRDFAAQQSAAPGNARFFASTTGGNFDTCFVGASARIDQAERGRDRRWRAAPTTGCTTDMALANHGAGNNRGRLVPCRFDRGLHDAMVRVDFRGMSWVDDRIDDLGLVDFLNRRSRIRRRGLTLDDDGRFGRFVLGRRFQNRAVQDRGQPRHRCVPIGVDFGFGVRGQEGGKCHQPNQGHGSNFSFHCGAFAKGTGVSC